MSARFSSEGARSPGTAFLPRETATRRLAHSGLEELQYCSLALVIAADPCVASKPSK